MELLKCWNVLGANTANSATRGFVFGVPSFDAIVALNRSCPSVDQFQSQSVETRREMAFHTLAIDPI